MKLLMYIKEEHPFHLTLHSLRLDSLPRHPFANTSVGIELMDACSIRTQIGPSAAEYCRSLLMGNAPSTSSPENPNILQTTFASLIPK